MIFIALKQIVFTRVLCKFRWKQKHCVSAYRLINHLKLVSASRKKNHWIEKLMFSYHLIKHKIDTFEVVHGVSPQNKQISWPFLQQHPQWRILSNTFLWPGQEINHRKCTESHVTMTTREIRVVSGQVRSSWTSFREPSL